MTDQGSANAPRIVGLARRSGRRRPMELLCAGDLTEAAGLAGDHKGARLKKRQVTVLAAEDWAAALESLGQAAAGLDWTVRRANILVAGVRLPRAPGAVIAVGEALVEVTAQTSPCVRMDEAFPGLLKALSPDWRGGVTGRVRRAARIAIGDPVAIVSSPPEHRIRLP